MHMCGIRKTVLTILHTGQQRRHRCKEQTFGFSGRSRGWDDLREQHWNMYLTVCKIHDQCEFSEWHRTPKASALRQPRGREWEEGGRAFRMGDTRVPGADSYWYMAKAITIFFFCILLFFPLIFISWRLITLQYCSGFCHTLTWISHGFTCVPHPGPPSHLPLPLVPLGLPIAPAPSTCLMHPIWDGDLFHPR